MIISSFFVTPLSSELTTTYAESPNMCQLTKTRWVAAIIVEVHSNPISWVSIPDTVGPSIAPKLCADLSIPTTNPYVTILFGSYPCTLKQHWQLIGSCLNAARPHIQQLNRYVEFHNRAGLEGSACVLRLLFFYDLFKILLILIIHAPYSNTILIPMTDAL